MGTWIGCIRNTSFANTLSLFRTSLEKRPVAAFIRVFLHVHAFEQVIQAVEAHAPCPIERKRHLIKLAQQIEQREPRLVQAYFTRLSAAPGASFFGNDEVSRHRASGGLSEELREHCVAVEWQQLLARFSPAVRIPLLEVFEGGA